MAEKQLIIVIEGTTAMGPYWQTIVFDYLENIIRCFCGNQLPGQKRSTSSVALSLITFYAHGSYCDSLVLRSGQTKDVDSFLQWLSAIQFGGGGFNDAAIAEGLSEALMMFPNARNGNQFQQNVNGQRHCILVAASNPYPFPTAIHRLQMQNLEQSENPEVQTTSCLFDVEAVAKLFVQCSISLSVICPRQLPKIRAIYNAGNRNTRAANLVVDNVKNPHFLVLISENFMEAHAALSPSRITNLASNQSLVQMDIASVPTVTRPPSTSMPPGSQVVQTGGVDVNQNKISGLDPLGVSSGTSTMIPTIEMPQQVQSGIQLLGVNNNSTANMTLSPHISSTLQSEKSKNVKVWEGNLSGERQGQFVYIARIEGYRIPSTSDTIAANWPSTMHIVRLISHDHMYNRQYFTKADFLVFRVINQHGFFKILQKKKLCAVIELPSQTLLLSGFDKAHHMIGMLFPRDMVEFKLQISSQQQQEQQQSQQQQHQQMQSQQHPQLQQRQYIQISDDESTELETKDATSPVEDLASVIKSMHEDALSLRNIQIHHDNGSQMLLEFIERFVKKFNGI